jgi:hypothetical protein
MGEGSPMPTWSRTGIPTGKNEKKSRVMVTEGLLGFFTKLFLKRLNTSARARDKFP